MMSDLLQMGVLSLISIACGLLGPFLVLKRMTMFANSLSHTVLLGIAVSFLIADSSSLSLFTLSLGAFFSALLTAFFTGSLIRVFRLQEDASVGLVFSALFALGITIVSVCMKSVHLGIEAVMGNVDILSFSDLKLGGGLAGVNILVISLFFRPLKLTSFDPNLAKVFRFPALNFLLLFLTALTCIGAFRAVGVLLVLALLVGPFLTARLFCHKLKTLLFTTPLIGVSASILGVLVARLLFDYFGLALSTGGIVTTLIGAGYLFARMVTKERLEESRFSLREKKQL
jgi:manganese/zinc/iron transport system permease protein